MVVKSNSISTERELEPVRWERIDKIKSLIKGKNITVSEDNIDFSLKLHFPLVSKRKFTRWS